MGLFLNASVVEGYPALDELPWRQRPATALHAVRELLTTGELPSEALTWISGLTSVQLERVIERSLERSTHFKWFLGEQASKYVVWLHEYKSPEIFAQASTFAASIHDHRYGFCSRVLNGALHVSKFELTRHAAPGLQLVEEKCVTAGDTMLLSHEDIHRIDSVDPHTYTVVIQGSAVRSYSTCYNVASGQGERLYDLRSRLPEAVEILSNHFRESLFIS